MTSSDVVSKRGPERERNQGYLLRFGFLATPEVLLSVFVLLVMIAFAGTPWLFATHDPFAQDLDVRLQGSSSQHHLGTDKLGRDVFSRIVYAARISLLIAGSSVLVSGILGVSAGIVAGYFGGRAETVLMRATDIQLALPPVLLAIVIVAIAGPSVQNLILVLVATAWVEYSRVIFNTVRSLREREFVIAAVALGASDGRILFRHVVPSQLGIVIVISSVQAGRLMLTEATLSFLGLGAQPPTPSWGNMLRDGYDLVSVAPWLNLYPGVALALTLYSINALGEALRRHFEPPQ